MPDLFEAIQAEAERTIAAVRAEAEAEAQAIIAEAQAHAPELITYAQREALHGVGAEEAQIYHQSQAAVHAIHEEVQRRIFESLLVRLHHTLAELHQQPSYPALLNRLVAEALDDLRLSLAEGERPVVHIHPRDRPHITNDHIDLVTDLTGWGGVRICSSDGRIVVDNTLEARLEASIPALRQLVLGWIGERHVS